MPKRTQRRVPDPYAIEDSDDELDQDLVTPKQKTEEESLIDFLRNTVPPPAAASSSTATPSTTPKESSNSALKDRLLRKASLSGVSRNGTLKKSTVSPPGYKGTTNGAREESPHQPTEPTHAAHLDRGRQKPRAVIEPRDPRSGGDSRELAAYLMNSGPTETPLPLSQPIKEEAGFLKFFSRRRTVKR